MRIDVKFPSTKPYPFVSLVRAARPLALRGLLRINKHEIAGKLDLRFDVRS